MMGSASNLRLFFIRSCAPSRFKEFTYFNNRAQTNSATSKGTFIRTPSVLTGKRFMCTKITKATDDEIIKSLCDGNADLEKKLRVLMLEVEVLRQEGNLVPDKLSKNEWKELVRMPTKTARLRELRYLFKVERKNENVKAKKLEYRLKRQDELSSTDTDDVKYGLGAYSMFLRISKQTMSTYDNIRALQANRFGQPFVLDCSYDDHMVNREAKNTAKQLTLLFALNRKHVDPFDLHICNADLNKTTMKQLKNNIPTLLDPCVPLHVHTKSYLDIFPKEKLVYLTPHCRNEVTEFDHDAIYIIGCIVDKSNNDALSLAKAKQEGIKMAKLPLDRYLNWGSGGGKCLTLNQILAIMLDLKVTGDWEQALKNVPKRKLMDNQFSVMSNQLKKTNNAFYKTLLEQNVIQKKNLIPKGFNDRKRFLKDKKDK